MPNKNTPAEGKDSAQLEAESALRDAACCAIPFMRGELLDLLAKGVECEVLERVAGNTEKEQLDWLGMDSCSVIKSNREGWVIFKHNK